MVNVPQFIGSDAFSVKHFSLGASHHLIEKALQKRTLP